MITPNRALIKSHFLMIFCNLIKKIKNYNIYIFKHKGNLRSFVLLSNLLVVFCGPCAQMRSFAVFLEILDKCRVSRFIYRHIGVNIDTI